MDLPRDSSDLAFTFACPVCFGNGGFGSRTGDGGNPRQPCANCNGSGWTLNRLADLSPEQARKLREKLASIPPDSDTAHHQDSTREQLNLTLNRRWIESIALPDGEATHIDLFGKHGDVLRIEPEFSAGKFRNLTATPLPPA